jgi:PHD/YefM family antitoxin component YafN of YafNO toxin-antitoxin module
MRTITVKQLEQNFDIFIEDVIENKHCYKIICDDGRQVMLIPYEEYDFLQTSYNEWIESTKDSVEDSI